MEFCNSVRLQVIPWGGLQERIIVNLARPVAVFRGETATAGLPALRNVTGDAPDYCRAALSVQIGSSTSGKWLLPFCTGFPAREEMTLACGQRNGDI